MFKLKLFLVMMLVVFAAGYNIALANDDVFQESCAECHGVDRLGGVGPALLPGNLKRLRKKSGH